MEKNEIEKLEKEIDRLVPWIKEKIDKSKDKTIRMKADDLLCYIDSILVDKESDGEIFDRIKDILSKEGIWVALGSHVIGNYTVYIMRPLSAKKEFIVRQIQDTEAEISKLKDNIRTMPADQLPDDLLKYLEDNVTY